MALLAQLKIKATVDLAGHSGYLEFRGEKWYKSIEVN